MKSAGLTEWIDHYDYWMLHAQKIAEAARRTRIASVTLTILAGFALVFSYRVLFSLFSFTHSMFSCSPCRHTWSNIGKRSFENDLCAPEIDVVYTWVNGSDQLLLNAIKQYRSEDGELAESKAAQAQKDTENGITNSQLTDDTKHGQNRFRDNDELKYSMRSLWMYAPWVRNVYIVTNGQVPSWMDITHPNLHIVTHEQIFPNRSHLPVFSSPAIEVHLHRIPGLSDQFLYFNDDTMLGNFVWPEDFWTRESGQKVYLSWDVPQCNTGCPDSWLNDNYCDPVCNTSSCNFDEGDCGPGSVQGSKGDASNKQWKGRPSPATRAESNTVHSHEMQTYCATGCPNSWLGDKVCDRACKTIQCGFDAGDCGTSLVRKSVQNYSLTQNGMEIFIPFELMSAYVDMAEIVPNTIISAEHECELFIRSAIIIQSEKLLILVFLPALPAPASCTVAVSTRDVNNGSVTERVVTFYIRREASGTSSSKSDASSGTPVSPQPASHLTPTEQNIHPSPDALAPHPQPNDRKLLMFNTFCDDMERVLRETVVLGIPSEKLPDQVIFANDMHEQDWIRAEKILRSKKLELLSLAQLHLEKKLGALLNTYESTLGPIWPWQLIDSKDQSQFLGHNRKMLDAFGDSLRFVTRLYNAYFSVKSRKVPAHMPHMIDKRIVAELQSIWPKEFDTTSSHRFRSSLDVQFAFSFFYYLMEKPERFDPVRFFRDEIDLDQDGYVSEMELRHLASTNRQIPFSEMTNVLINCSLALASARGHNLTPSEGVSVTEETFKSCPTVLNMLKPIVELRRFYKHQKMTMDQVTFYMVGDNATVVRHRLEEILVERKKFICLNDDMRNPEPGVSMALNEFLDAYFPKSSP